MKTAMFKGREIKVMEVSNGRKHLLSWIILLMFCLCLFSTDATAQYSVYNKGDSDVYGYYNAGDLLMYGALFDSVVADANYNSAYGLYSSGGNITIDGTYVSDGYISAITGTYDAFGLFSPNGSINTGKLDGTINTFAGTSWAIGLFGETITTGVIDGTITATAGDSWAIGLNGIETINTGDIDGTIVARASNNEAYGLLSGGLASIHTGSINGTISAEATYGSDAYAICSDSSITIDGDIGSDANIVAIAETSYAFGLYSGGSGDANSIHITGDIDGRITADVNSGSEAYAMYSGSNIVIDGDIGSTALIGATATAGEESAYGMYSDDSITIGDINGTIFAEMTEGYEAYAIYAVNDITIGNIGSDADIWAAANYGDAYGLYSGIGLASIHIGNIDGKISADVNDGYRAYAIYSDSNIVIDGNIGSTAEITATAGYGDAYGLYSGGIGDANLIRITGNIDGKITADVNDGDGAYAIYSASNIIVDGNITSTALISATATGGTIPASAYGMYSDDSITIGDVNGTISAEMTEGYNASAIYAANDITIGNIGIDADIWAAAEYGNAYGLNSGGGEKSIHINGDIDGKISADVNDGSYAYAMYSDTDIIIDGNISSTAEITATAEYGDAYGMYSGGGADSIHINGDIDGKITADVNDGSGAYAIYSDSNVVIDGDIGSTALISATASGEGAEETAYGIKGNTLNISGDIHGIISAEMTDGYGAYTLYADSNMVIGNIGSDANIWARTAYGGSYTISSDAGSVTIGDVNGIISADVNDGSSAYAIYSHSDLEIGNIGSDANISATAGQERAYALYSGVGSIDVNDIDGVISADVLDGSWAYGLYSGAGLSIHVDDVNGVITADANDSYAYAMWSREIIEVGDIESDALISAEAGQDRAYALYSQIGSIDINDIDGEISAETFNGSYAYALYSGEGDSIHIDDINGVITADANGSEAYAMWSYENIDIEGDIGSDALISATAGQDWAAALYSEDDSIDIYGEINGDISAQAINGSNAYGLYSDESSIDTGGINGTITADANDSEAYAMWSYGNIDIEGDIGPDALISATAGQNVGALYSDSGTIYVGDINGEISATALNGSNAYGMYGGSSATIEIYGDVNGVITADANGSDAYAMRTYGNIEIYGDITSEALISATAGDDWAAALYSDGGSIYVGDIDGEISAQTLNGSDAYGLYSRSTTTIETGDVNGVITADANDSYAYGMYSDGLIEINGDITSNAMISATAGENDAGALYSENGSIYIYGDIDGEISATAINGSNAYGLYSGAGFSIYTYDVNGTIIADANQSEAYAMYSYGDIDIDGNIGDDAIIAATAGEDNAAGLYSYTGDVNTGDIDGTITAVAGSTNAAGLYANNGSVITGDINGEITAMAEDGYAAGLYSSFSVSIHVGDVNGIIIADVNNGPDAYGMYSASSITTGDILSDAYISATASGNNAYGLYSYYGDIDMNDIDGTITATSGGDDAGGLYSYFGDVNVGDINGMISARASGVLNDTAYGIYGGDSVFIGDVNGTISAAMTYGSGAYAVYSATDITTGDILDDAYISASAEYGSAAGLYSGSGTSIHTGDVNGVIIADVNNGSEAYGMYSYSGIKTGDIGVDAEIIALAEQDAAVALYSAYEDVNVGDINGLIGARAGSSFASGLYAEYGSVITGDINGAVIAMAGDGFAAALYSNESKSIHTGDVNGVILAEVDNGSEAYGMYSTSSITIGDILSDAQISATAESGEAYGLYSGGGSINTGDVNGVIIAYVNDGDDAFGMYSGSITTGDFGVDSVITATAGGSYVAGLSAMGIETGALNGTITATADANYARGLSAMSLETGPINGTITAVADVNYAYGLSAISLETGAIGGTISATAGQDYAVGLFVSGTLTTGQISGVIDANAGGDLSYGILSYGAMDVNIVGGTVSAVANDGNNVAAIQSGRFVDHTLDSQDANDTLGIMAGSTIIGDIDLAQDGTDDDVLTLWGNDANSTIFADDINNVETIIITGGHWYVNGSVTNNLNGITMSGGILSGNGTLETLYVGEGTFSPGGSIDTITVDNVVFNSDSIFEVDVNNAEDSDKVIVNEMAYLDGTIRGRVYGSDRIDHSFSALVIDANELSGEFADVNGATMFPIFSVSYDTDNNDVYLGVLFDYAYYARTSNQRAVGWAFNQIVESGRDTGDMNDVLTAIENLPDGSAVNEAYNQLMPQDMLGLPDVTRRIMNQHNDGIMERMDNLRWARQYSMLENNRYLLADAGDSFALPSQVGEWMPFVKGIGVWADRDSERDIAGYKYSVYGAIAGMDKQVSDNSLLGFGIGGTKTSVDYSRAGTEADIDSLLLSLHGSYFGDDWFFDYTAGYGHSWYDQKRSISFLNRTAKSDHDSDAFSVAIEYGMNLGGGMAVLEPVAGMGYTLVREEGYTESDAGAANLKVDSETSDGFYSKLGLQATTEMQFENNPNMVMVPKLSAFWIHDFADRVELSSSFVGGGSFTTDGLDPVRDMFNIGAGLNAYFNSNTRIFVDYVWQFSSDFESNMLQAGIQWPF